MNTISTSALTHEATTVSVDDLKKLKEYIDRLPMLDQWIVIDPQGRMYKGSVAEMTRVLLSEHPWVKAQLVFEFDGEESL